MKKLPISLLGAVLVACLCDFAIGQPAPEAPAGSPTPPGSLGLADPEIEQLLIEWSQGVTPPEPKQVEIWNRLGGENGVPRPNSLATAYLYYLRLSLIYPGRYLDAPCKAMQYSEGDIKRATELYQELEGKRAQENFPRELRLMGRLWPSVTLGKTEYSQILDELGKTSPVDEALGVVLLHNGLNRIFAEASPLARETMAEDPIYMAVEAEIAQRSRRLFAPLAEAAAQRWYQAVEAGDWDTINALAGHNKFVRTFHLKQPQTERAPDAPQGNLPQEFSQVQGFTGPVDLGSPEVISKVMEDWTNSAGRPLKGSRGKYEMTSGYVTMADALDQTARTSVGDRGGPDNLAMMPGYVFRFVTKVETPPDGEGHKHFDREELILGFGGISKIWKVTSWSHN